MRTCCCISADRLYRSEMRSSDMATMRSAACCTPRASPELASSNSVPRLTTSCEIGRNFNLAGFIKGGSKGAHHEIDTRSRGAWLSPAAATDRSAAGGAARPRSTGSARDPAELELQSQRQSGAMKRHQGQAPTWNSSCSAFEYSTSRRPSASQSEPSRWLSLTITLPRAFTCTMAQCSWLASAVTSSRIDSIRRLTCSYRPRSESNGIVQRTAAINVQSACIQLSSKLFALTAE